MNGGNDGGSIEIKFCSVQIEENKRVFAKKMFLGCWEMRRMSGSKEKEYLESKRGISYKGL